MEAGAISASLTKYRFANLAGQAGSEAETPAAPCSEWELRGAIVKTDGLYTEVKYKRFGF
jgi:hypothetical protein